MMQSLLHMIAFYESTDDLEMLETIVDKIDSEMIMTKDVNRLEVLKKLKPIYQEKLSKAKK